MPERIGGSCYSCGLSHSHGAWFPHRADPCHCKAVLG